MINLQAITTLWEVAQGHLLVSVMVVSVMARSNCPQVGCSGNSKVTTTTVTKTIAT